MREEWSALTGLTNSLVIVACNTNLVHGAPSLLIVLGAAQHVVLVADLEAGEFARSNGARRGVEFMPVVADDDGPVPRGVWTAPVDVFGLEPPDHLAAQDRVRRNDDGPRGITVAGRATRNPEHFPRQSSSFSRNVRLGRSLHVGRLSDVGVLLQHLTDQGLAVIHSLVRRAGSVDQFLVGEVVSDFLIQIILPFLVYVVGGVLNGVEAIPEGIGDTLSGVVEPTHLILGLGGLG